MIDPPQIFLADEKGYEQLQVFAARHGLKTLKELLQLSVAEYWQMEGFTVFVQEELVLLCQKHGLLDQLQTD